MPGITVATFNLRKDARTDGANRWANREPLVQRIIRKNQIDVLGVQEVLPAMRQDLERDLAEYVVVGFGRKKDLSNEHSDILANRMTTQLSFYTTFWLSRIPYAFGSRFMPSIFPRICTVAELYLQGSRRKIRVLNTHLDHLSGYIRQKEIACILEHIQRLQEAEYLPTILMGDLNALPMGRLMTRLRECRMEGLGLRDVYADHHGYNSRTNTYHSFKGKAGRRHLDYIYASEEFQIQDCYIDRSSENGRYPSDHYPLVARLELA